MKQLVYETMAYRTFAGDVQSGRLSHAYMLHFNDQANLRAVLKLFALKFFGESETSIDGRRILNENFSDLSIIPEEGKKINAEAATSLIAESVLMPVERNKKLFIITEFNEASALVQNKLLKTLEEPEEGVYFLLGVTTLAPILDTIKSRVKTLEIPAFGEQDILAALEREAPNDLNRAAAQSCGGILGVAQNMVSGGWFAEVYAAAEEIATTTRMGDVGAVAAKYGDSKRKSELINAIGLNFFNALKQRTQNLALGRVARLWTVPALIYAAESIDRASEDLKFNASFSGLLFDLMMRIIEVNDKWSKLQA